MVRHRRRLLEAASLAAFAALAGCGIKGPLTLPPKPDPATPGGAEPAAAKPEPADAKASGVSGKP
jgi:predicted small lipoprotein YifL